MNEDFEVVWSGKGAMPHEQRDAEYLALRSQRRESQLLQASVFTGESAERRRGRMVRNRTRPPRTTTQQSPRKNAAPTARCRGCFDLVPVRDLSKGLSLCPLCRPGRQRAVRYAE